MRIGFIGLGNVGGKLAGSLLRNGFDLTVRDLNEQTVREFIERGANFGESPKLIPLILSHKGLCWGLSKKHVGKLGFFYQRSWSFQSKILA